MLHVYEKPGVSDRAAAVGWPTSATSSAWPTPFSLCRCWFEVSRRARPLRNASNPGMPPDQGTIHDSTGVDWR
ncbi:MAG: hypothetical protein ABI112_06580 [Terracoccus sp.]